MKPLPPDPDTYNEQRSMSAGLALRALIRATNVDFEDAPADLLTNLMHWCDRHDKSFDAEYARARTSYLAETTIPYTVESEDINDAL